ncbi:type 2 periplasmic-binding domain-containing protein [Paracraurococcus lichenis]|uniref:Solute-binding protein family 3/N-terminal domain-containing protein n=1 Tax=Paracraurococcus lichenis TaxID=3064888 RepID=A0ABT9DZ99_9PROT|nr:hypothetical protein [Paracraurococcus sp. LOR1-02]MDO9709204.1 hypothetical protein [Paracraurococcus sp. LOR1-02]
MRRAAAAALLLATLSGAASAEEALTVCLEEDVPPLSMKRGKEGAGFDLEVARRVAALLGRPLRVQWYETEADPDSQPDRQVNALLSDGKCDLAGGYPLAARALGRPMAERAKLPDFDGARPEDRRRWVALGTLVPTPAYRAGAIGVVMAPGKPAPQFRHLAELQGLRIGVEEKTLPDAIVTHYRGGMLLGTVTHVTAGRPLFEGLARGDYDAVVVELHRYDAWRARHPDSGLTLTEYRHPIAFNFGFVGLSTAAPLVQAAGAAVTRMREAGELPAIAERTGLTYAPPQVPEVTPPLRTAALRDD